jgi:hypothetical protein
MLGSAHRVSVLLLQEPEEPRRLAIHAIEIIVGQLGPLCLQTPAKVLVHARPPDRSDPRIEHICHPQV